MSRFKPSLLASAIASTFLISPISAYAESAPKAEKSIEVIEVTATRRSGSAQAPLNITAVDADVMKDQNIAQLEDVARWYLVLLLPIKAAVKARLLLCAVLTPTHQSALLTAARLRPT